MRLSIITILSIFFCLGLFNRSFSQVAIGTTGSSPAPNSKAVLLLVGNGTQGIMIPVVTNKSAVGATKMEERGMVVFDDSDKKVYYFDGTNWNLAGGGAAGSQVLSISGNLVQLSGSPSSSFPLASSLGPTANQNGQLLMWNQVDRRWEATSSTAAANGNVLTWNSTTNTWEPKPIASTSSLANGQIFVGNASNVATAIAPSTFPLSNFGAATAAVSMGNNKITNVATPTSPTDAANKSYVDANVLPSLSASQLLSNNGANTGITVAGDLGLSVTGTTGTFTIANNSVTDAKVATGISGSKINPAFGSQNISTSGTLTSGAATLTALTVSGATTSLNNKTYTWPNNPTLLAGTFLQTDASGNLSWAPALGAGTVSSVGLSMPSIFTVTNSPVIAAGTLTASLNSQAANSFLASPSGAAGVPGFRTLVAADIPNLDAGKITTGTVPIANGGTNSTSTPTNGGISYGTGTAYAFTTAGTAGQVLQSNGAAAPTWVNAPAPTGAAGGDLAGNYPNPTIGATATTGANVITSINAASTATINTARLNASVVLDTEAPAAGDMIGNFSTGLQIGSGVIANADISATAAIAATKLAAGTSGQILQTNGSLVPTWTTPAFASNTLTNSQIFVGNASNVATGVAMSGDATILNTGALTLANTAATRANLGLGTMAIQDKSAVSINGGTINGLTAPIDIGSGGTGTNSVTLNGVAYGAIGAINYTAPGTAGQLLQSNGATPPSWVNAPTTGWSLTGNAGTVDGTNFIGTTDAIPLNLRVNNIAAGRIESAAANANTLYGYQSGNVNTGIRNAGFGYQALLNNAAGQRNAAYGYQAMLSNTTGNGNTAVGSTALSLNTTGGANTAVGTAALANNTGSTNTAVGNTALTANTIATDNAAVGTQSLGLTTTGGFNSALGSGSLFNTTGANNTGVGYYSLATNTTGSTNTALGYRADVTTNALTNATAIGANAKVAASNSLVLGGTGVDAVNVGINTTSPTQRLDVVGNVKFSGALMPNNLPGTAGQVLTSAGGGNAPTWASVATSISPVNTVIKGDAAGTAQVASQIFDDGTSVSIASVPTTNITKLTVQNEVSGGPNNTVSGTKGLRVAVADNSNTQVAALETRVTGANAGQQIGIFNSVDGTVGQNRGIVTSAQNSPSTNSAIEAYAQGNAGTNYGIQVNIGGTQAASKYGLFINAAGSGTKYGVYSQGEDINYFSGKVGIGTTSTASILSVDAVANNYVRFDEAGAFRGLVGVASSANDLATGSTDNDMVLRGNANLALATGSTVKMLINSAGNVGIGTTNPTYLLTLGSGAFAMENASQLVAKNSGGTYETYLWPRWSDDIMYLNYGSAGFNIRNNSSTPTMFMTNAGNVGIGTTTPGYKLAVNGSASVNTFNVANTTSGAFSSSATFNGGVLFQNQLILNAVPNVTGSIVSTFDNVFDLGSSSNRWRFVYAGNGTIQTSDSRLKENIKDLSYGLADIIRLRPVSYNWKKGTKEMKLGLIAQETEKVIPEVVSKPEGKDGYYGMMYSDLIPVLIKATQELNAKIEALEKENSQLKGTNTELQTEVASLKDKQVSEMEVLKKQMEEIKKVLGMEANAKKK